MPDDTTAPVTAEGLRERLVALLVARHSRGLCPPAGPCDDCDCFDPEHKQEQGEAGAIIAELAGDPGDLPARMAEVIAEHEWNPGLPNSAHARHNYHWACAICAEDLTRIAEVALSVRWEHAVHLAARLADAERRAEAAEGELSAVRDHSARWETAERERDHWKRQHDELMVAWQILGERTIVASTLVADDMPADIEAEIAPVRLDVLRQVLAGEAGRDDLSASLLPRLAEYERRYATRIEAQVAALREELAGVGGQGERDLEEATRQRERAEQAEAQVALLTARVAACDEERERLRAAHDRLGELIESYPPGSDFAQSGAQSLFRRMHALDARPDDPEEIRRLAQATTEEEADG